jgi:hypothetical protein
MAIIYSIFGGTSKHPEYWDSATAETWQASQLHITETNRHSNNHESLKPSNHTEKISLFMKYITCFNIEVSTKQFNVVIML